MGNAGFRGGVQGGRSPPPWRPLFSICSCQGHHFTHAPGAMLGAFCRLSIFMTGALQEPNFVALFSVRFEKSWDHVEPSWGRLGPSGGLLGVLLGPSWGRLEAILKPSGLSWRPRGCQINGFDLQKRAPGQASAEHDFQEQFGLARAVLEEFGPGQAFSQSLHAAPGKSEVLLLNL